MIGVRRKYDEGDKMKAKAYYLEHREEIKEKSRIYYAENKCKLKHQRFRIYAENKTTKKYKNNLLRIEKINKEIERLKNGKY